MGDNAKELWGADWAKYRAAHPNDQDCGISESDNWKGAQQCSQSWECRGARLCERCGWCSGYDGCEGTPLPDQAPGLAQTTEQAGSPPNIQLTAIRDGPCADTRSLMVTLIN